MQNQITPVNSVFQFESNVIRIIVIENEPWFIASDICNVLGYKSTYDGTRMLEGSELHTHIVRGNKGDRKVSIINESGLYSLIFRSRKPEALKFTKWVTSEVLPTIRKTGSYSVTQQKEKPASLRELVKKDFIMARDMFSTLPDPMRSCAYRELIDKTISIYKNRLAILLEAHH